MIIFGLVRILLLTIFIFALFIQGKSQLTVNSKYEPDSLLKHELLGKTSSLEISDVSFVGMKSQIGTFETEFSDHIDIKEGVILATGMIQNAIGPNVLPNKTTNFQGKGDEDLSKIAVNRTYDAAILEFTFIPNGNHFEFQYVFASEEYPEFVNGGVNDVFAFILTDVETGRRENLAYLPISKEPVTVDNVNSNKNSEHFILNGKWIKGKNQIYAEDKELGEYAYNFQYDGFTTWLKAESAVVPGKEYRLKIAIADAGDGAFDSAVLLKKHSFKAETDIPEGMKQELDELSRYFDSEHVIQRDDSLVLILNIHFDHDDSEIIDEKDIVNLEEVFHLISRNPKLFLLVEGFTDSRGEKEYNHDLSERRAKSAQDWLVKKGAASSRISFIGKGMENPVASNQTEAGRAKNRRIEFVFYLSK